MHDDDVQVRIQMNLMRKSLKKKYLKEHDDVLGDVCCDAELSLNAFHDVYDVQLQIQMSWRKSLKSFCLERGV